MKKIGVLTSGGDSPGMNAAVRSVVRTAIANDIEVYGINQGYYGMYHDDIVKLESKSVSDIINRGGTFLESARFPEFKEEEVRKEAIKNLDKHGIEAIVVIGGDGSYMGAKKLSEMGYPCIGIPGTIDNDAPRTDFTIGFDTALNTIVEAVDKLRDTSGSHYRCSVVEVMGRDAGDLALWAGISTGAEFTLIPEIKYDIEEVKSSMRKGIESGKRHFILIVAEGCEGIKEMAPMIEKELNIETRLTTLGHIQRGGNPTALDRVLASRMGAYSVELLQQGEKARCIGLVDNKLVHNDIIEAMSYEHIINEKLYKIANYYLNI